MAATRCGPLCQHPVCWQYSERQSSSETDRGDIPLNVDAPSLMINKPRVYYNDLPTITIIDATQNASLSPPPPPPPPPPTRSLSLPPISSSQRSSLYSPWPSKQFNFTQFLLHQDDNMMTTPTQATPSLDSYEFIPILFWKPTNNNNNKRKDREEEKEEKKLLKINNLTMDGLPPSDSREGVVTAERLRCIQRKNMIEVKREREETHPISAESFGFTIDKYIVDGLSDVPPHVVNQIIQQLRSHKHVHVIDDDKKVESTPPTPPPTTCSRPLKPLPNHSHVPASIVLNLSSQKLYSTSSTASASSFTSSSPSLPGNGTSSLTTSHMTTNTHTKKRRAKRDRVSTKDMSFSRALARRPSEALTGLRARITDLQSKANQNTTSTNTVIRESEKGNEETRHDLFPTRLELPHSGQQEIYSKYLSPRSLNKAIRQRLVCPSIAYSDPLMTTTNKPHPLDSTHFKTMRQFSEDLLSRPQTNQAHSHTTRTRTRIMAQRRPHSRTTTWDPHVRSIGIFPHSRSGHRPYSHALSSAQSSDHVIYDANITNTNDTDNERLFLMNKEGEVIHEVSTDVLPLLSLPDPAEEEEEERDESLCPLEGMIAPPPSARENNDELITPSICNTATPSNELLMPTNNTNTPSAELLTPTQIETPPNNENLTPSQIETSPNNENLTPTQIETPPNNENLTPTQIETPPNNGDLTPTQIETPPNNGDLTPTQIETPPNNENLTPT